MSSTAEEMIDKLALAPHPEGGFCRETWRDAAKDGRRGTGTAIYFLIRAGERTHWHRVDATEIWHYYAGACLALSIHAVAGPPERLLLGADLARGERPQAIVSKGAWQSAETLGDWSLLGCTVSPAFEFAGFELAPPDWSPVA